MLTTLLRWFQAPRFPDDEDKTRSALLLNVLLNTFIIALPVLVVGVVLGGAVPRQEIIIRALIVAWLLVMGLRYIMLAGQIAMAGMMLIGVIFLLTTFSIYNLGTIRAPATSFYVLVVVTAGLIVSRRAILWMAGLSAITIILFLNAEIHGLLPEADFSVRITQGVTFTVSMGIISSLLYLAVKSIDEALTRARQELSERQRAEKMIRGLLESAPDAIVVGNADGVILFANSQLETLFGYAREEVLGQRVEMLMPAHSAEVHPSYREQYSQNPHVLVEGVKRQFYARRKDGSQFPVEIGLSPMSSTNDSLVIAVIRDITERIRGQQERERYIEELSKQNAELERFTYTVSHDLRNPLVTIKGFLGSLERDLQDGRQDRLQSDFRRIAGAADKMDTLLSELLELSRIGRLMNPPEDVDIVRLVQDATETLDARIRSNKIVVNVAPDLPRVFGDRIRLREVFENLINNAAKFMGDQPDPLIEIGMRGTENPIFFVKDNGIGIESQYHQKIFSLFEKLDSTIEGTGIGLALVKRIIEAHGGRIWVESAGLGMGSAFCFTLPEKINDQS